MKISYKNAVDDFTISSSAEVGGYESSNVQNPHLSKTWRMDSYEGWILVDTVSGLNPECVFVSGSGFTDTTVIKIQGNDQDEWDNPPLNLELSALGDIYYSWDSLGEYRYWRLSVYDFNQTVLRISRFWLGDILEITNPSTIFTEQYIDTSETFISNSGQVWGNEKYSYYLYEMSYPVIDNSEKDDITEFRDYCHGSKSFFTSFSDLDGNKLGPFYMIQTEDLKFVHLKTLNMWSVALSYRQAF